MLHHVCPGDYQVGLLLKRNHFDLKLYLLLGQIEKYHGLEQLLIEASQEFNDAFGFKNKTISFVS